MNATMDQVTGARWIRDAVKSGTPFLAGKLGTSELDALYFYLGARRPSVLTSTFPSYPVSIRKNLCVNAGLFPATDAVLDDWAAHMLSDVLPTLDCVAQWNPGSPIEESTVLQFACPSAIRCKLRSLEPYYEAATEDRWTTVLPDRVAVVSPFAPSIATQWAKRDEVWRGRALWGDSTTVIPVRCGYSAMLTDKDEENAWPAEIRTWRMAVDAMADAVVRSGAPVALLGCGALSLPIGAELKRRGISAIHTGGATQILFGIKGRRWATHDVISTFFNEAWVSPSPSEIPSRATAVEGGCYW